MHNEHTSKILDQAAQAIEKIAMELTADPEEDGSAQCACQFAAQLASNCIAQGLDIAAYALAQVPVDELDASEAERITANAMQTAVSALHVPVEFGRALRIRMAEACAIRRREYAERAGIKPEDQESEETPPEETPPSWFDMGGN